jgi:hypothetical protein
MAHTKSKKDNTQIANPRRIWTKWALLEYSDVPVPSNPEAIQEMKTKGLLTEEQAAKYLPELKPEGGGWDETDSSFRYRVRDPDAFINASFRTVPIKRDKPRVNSVMGKLKGGNGVMKVQSIIFPKEDGWTKGKASSWLSNHPNLTKQMDEAMEDEEYAKYWGDMVITDTLETTKSLDAFALQSDLIDVRNDLEELRGIITEHVDKEIITESIIDWNSINLSQDDNIIDIQDDPEPTAEEKLRLAKGECL